MPVLLRREWFPRRKILRSYPRSDRAISNSPSPEAHAVRFPLCAKSTATCPPGFRAGDLTRGGGGRINPSLPKISRLVTQRANKRSDTVCGKHKGIDDARSSAERMAKFSHATTSCPLLFLPPPGLVFFVSLFLHDPDRAGLGVSRKHVSLELRADDPFSSWRISVLRNRTKQKRDEERIREAREGEHADESAEMR